MLFVEYCSILPVDLVNGLVGVSIGFATGFYFERRASAAARQENAALRKELSRLRESVYAVGAEPERVVPRGERSDGAGEEMRLWIHDHQGADGGVEVSRVVGEFTGRGLAAPQVHDELSDLVEAGLLRRGDGSVFVR